jgi:protein-S-isoprenylcysteine O-methyltransferase Ste14
MNIETIFRLIVVVLFVSAFAISGYFRSKADHEGGRLRSAEGQGLVVVLRLLGLLALLPLFGYLINPDWVTWARVQLPDWLRWLAALVAVSLIPMFYWVLSNIGNNISPVQTTRQNHKLITSGPYHYIRHPLYTFGFVFMVAITLLTGLWWLAVAALPPLLILLWRTPIEEQRLIETFGDEYREYMKRTGRFFPRLR